MRGLRSQTSEAARRHPARFVLLKNVQSLRAIAALLVVLDHVSYEILHSDPGGRSGLDGFRYIGQFGVDLFFVISGFIMVCTSWTAFHKANASVVFGLRRLARVFPSYWFVLAPILVAYAVAPHTFFHREAGRVDVWASVLLIPSSKLRLLDVSWTLTYELYFYFFFAMMLLARRRWLGPMLVLWAIATFVASLVWFGTDNPYLEFVSSPISVEFMAGAGIGMAYSLRRMPRAMTVGAFGVFLLVGVWAVSTIPGITLVDLSKRDLVRLMQFGIPAVAIVYGAVGWELREPSKAPLWLVDLGNVSYATYLWHVPVSLVLGAIIARAHVRGYFLDTLAQVFTIGLIYVVSLVAYRFFERPVTAYLNERIVSWFVANRSSCVALVTVVPPGSADPSSRT